MTTIKAPFNFVPVSENVFFPDWADQISHDIPFKDGESGVIELKITAEVPLFIRNGHTKKDGETKSDTYKSFSKISDRYFIPGTSIKGAIRNVLEIMSFGKMTQVENDSFGIRDLNSQDYRALMKKQRCGWLQYVDDHYMLTDCGEPGRISLDAIDAKFGTKLSEFAKNRDNFKKNAGRTAEAKYKTIGYHLYRGAFMEDTETIIAMTKANPVDKRAFVKFGGNRQGTLVLTGQPGVRQQKEVKKTKKMKWNGKFYEFVFFDTNTPPKEVNSDIIRAFKTVHKNSPDFANYWGPKLNRGEKIPVFFQYILSKDGKELLHSMGLSYLYKYPCRRSVYEAIPHDLKTNRYTPDLADCIFGYSSKKNALKGRVQFSAAFSDTAELDSDKILILGSPKASYYPIYICQDHVNGRVTAYSTYDNGRIAGWKRYMVRKDIWDTKKTGYNQTLDTVIHPVKEGTVFIGKIRFHNLKKIELGALLSALTFHNSNKCFHQFGQGKPYGFGKATVEIKLSDELESRKLELMAMFEDAVSKEIKQPWCDSKEMKEFFTMAKEEVNSYNHQNFTYMIMGNDRSKNDRSKNEFLKAKSEGDSLRAYSTLISNIPFTPETLLNNLRKQQNIQYTELIKKAELFFSEKKHIESKNILEEAARLLPDNTAHRNLLEEVDLILAQQRKEEEERKIEEERSAERKKKVECGLSFLDEKNLKEEYKVTDFKGAKNRIDQWIKKTNHQLLPNEQWDILRACITRLIQKPDKKELKMWKDFNSHIWKTLTGYIGEETAKKWFEELIK
jgi:CRISPR-associated protein (TIGR03986 family)